MTIWQRLSQSAAAIAPSGLAESLFRGLGVADTVARPEVGATFTIALIALSAKMAKSDGLVTHDEVAAFRRVCSFAPEDEANVRRLFDLAKQDVAGYETYARQIRRALADDPALRRDVLEGMFVIAAADGVLHEREERYLETVAGLLEIPGTAYAHVRSLFVRDVTSPYLVLGLTPDATGDEVKARHRQLVLEHHPDRLIGRGVPAEFVTISERKLAAINHAFDQIAAERGM